MCGICGIYNFNSDNNVDSSLIQQMIKVIKHRGPDDEGTYINKNIGLGHCRLSTIDLIKGHQPICSEDKTVWIICDGEIYNFQDLRNELIKKGHIFYTNSDTETIVHLYEEKKEDFVIDLNGVFAIAIWDEKNKKLILARDRLGKKPLYYSTDKDKLVFASEIKSILEDKTFIREIDYEALDDYFSFICVPAPKSIFKNIKKLLPGHILVATPEKLSIREYWDLTFLPDKNKDEKYYSEHLLKLLTSAVECRLISEVPLGAFLSGGIDSSGVVALMATLLDQPVTTLSIGFREEAFNELDFARLIVQKYKTNHYEYIVTQDAVDIINKLVWYFDEPFADSSAIPTYYASKIAKEHVKVVLAGDGGDETFAGYTRRYFHNRVENQIRDTLPNFVRTKILPPIAKYYPKLDWLPGIIRIFQLKTILTNITLSLERAFFNSMAIFNDEFKDKLYTSDLKAKLGGYNSFNLFEYYFNKTKGWDPLSKLQYVDTKTSLPNDGLVKVDRMSMAVSLGVRTPFLDHKLVEFAATIPAELKLKGMTSKYILKKTLAPLLPQEILTRKKRGFAVPIEMWFKNGLKDITEQTLFHSKLAQRGYFNIDFIRWMWDQHQKGLRNFSSHLWTLLMFELWCQRFIDNASSYT